MARLPLVFEMASCDQQLCARMHSPRVALLAQFASAPAKLEHGPCRTTTKLRSSFPRALSEVVPPFRKLKSVQAWVSPGRVAVQTGKLSTATCAAVPLHPGIPAKLSAFRA
jgi:hypothetical protein